MLKALRQLNGKYEPDNGNIQAGGRNLHDVN